MRNSVNANISTKSDSGITIRIQSINQSINQSIKRDQGNARPLNCRIDPDPDVCRKSSKMLWIYYLVGVSYFAKLRNDRSVTVWKMLINLVKFHNFLKIRNSEDPLSINLAVAEYEILGDPYLGPKPHQKLTSSSDLQI